MSEPIVFISRNRIKEGRGSEFRRHYADSIPFTLETKTGTLAQLGYEDEDGGEFTVVRVFPDAKGLDLQLQGADERSKKTHEFIEPVGIEILGRPSAATLERMQKIAGSGVTVKISPVYAGGFIRELNLAERGE
jgi:hypothetical protein